MNMTFLDWLMTAAVLGLFAFVASYANRMTTSVADYLVAGRGAGRYMLTVSSGTEWIGVIAISAMFEAFYVGGLNAMWWSMATTPLFAYLQISGFGMYRFRETRAMTIAEFLERRYSRAVRTLGATISWISGMVAFGFVPLITAKFLMALIGLPAHFACLGMQIPTYPVMTALVVGLPLLFVLSGGHLTVLVSDFVQGMFMNIAALTLVFTLLSTVFHWDQVVFAMKAAGSADASLLNPLATSQMKDFGPGFFFTAVVLQAYSVMSNVAAQGFTGSAKNAHELRMGNLLAQIRWQGVLVFFMAFVLVTHMYMQHPAHAQTAAAINHSIDLTLGQQGAAEGAVGAVARTQMLVPTALTYMLPHGLIGLFCAMMVAALISSSNAMTHAWGSVLMQDIILPLRKKPLEPKQHIWALRASVLAVALITFALSLLIKPTQSIMQCLALFGALWLGSAGAVILGGLYWKKGTTKAAVITLIFGLVAGTALLVLTQTWGEISPRYTHKAFLQSHTVTRQILSGERAIDRFMSESITASDKKRLVELEAQLATAHATQANYKQQADAAFAEETRLKNQSQRTSADQARLQALDIESATLQKNSGENQRHISDLEEQEGKILAASFNAFLPQDGASIYRADRFQEVEIKEDLLSKLLSGKPSLMNRELLSLAYSTKNEKGSSVANIAAQETFPISGQASYLGTALASILVYVLASLLGRQPDHDMDKLLHRGKYAIADELLTHDQPVAGWQRLFGITRMFNREDRITAYLLMGYFLVSLAVFAAGMIYGYLKHPSENQWASFWGIFLIVQVVLLVSSTLWLGIGGCRDVFSLFRALRAEKPNPSDSGELKHNGH